MVQINSLESHQSYCPYCGEKIELLIDGSIPEQEYIEDCFVCCRPIEISICVDTNGDIHIVTKDENDV